MKELEVKGLLSNLGIKTPLSKIILLNVFVLRCIKMNVIVNKFLLVEDKFIPELQLKQPQIYLYCLWSIYQKKQIV